MRGSDDRCGDIGLAAPGGIDQNDVAVVQGVHGLPHVGGGQCHLQRQTDDVRIRAQLIDRGDSICVGGDESHATVMPQLVRRRDLRQGR